jgi:hypothetical protein
MAPRRTRIQRRACVDVGSFRAVPSLVPRLRSAHLTFDRIAATGVLSAANMPRLFTQMGRMMMRRPGADA